MDRYHRQIILNEFGALAQKKLKQSKVLVVGAGGLGVPVLQYLNAMGVGCLGIIDQDVVSLTNLHRQVIYNEESVGLPKVVVAEAWLKQQNSTTTIDVYNQALTVTNALDIITNYDVIVDATDNFPTRYLINDACVILDKPFIYGALHKFEGHVSVFNHNNGPTYRCLYPEMPGEDEIPNCNEVGVLGVLPGIIGNLQALETIKVISNVGNSLAGKLLVFNALDHSYFQFKIQKNQLNLERKFLQRSYQIECKTETTSITSLQLNELLKTNKVQVIDVRSPGEFQQNHLNGAVNIPLNQIISSKHEIDFNVPIYLICQSGFRSKKAIEILKEQYPTSNFINIKEGMNGFRTL